MEDMKQDLAKLALADALAKTLKKVTDPKGDGLRRDVDDAMRDDFERTGSTQRMVSVNGEKVGTISARMTKARSGVKLVLEDADALEAWLMGDGHEYLSRLLASYWPKLAEWMEADGVLPDGCSHEAYSEPARWAGTTLRVDAKKVSDALGGSLPAAVAGLLAGEDE